MFGLAWWHHRLRPYPPMACGMAPRCRICSASAKLAGEELLAHHARIARRAR